MLSVAIATVMGFPQVRTISFKSNFESLEKVVERLSRETEVPMAAYGEARNFPIYINVKDVPVNDLLAKIAAVSGTEWQQKDKSYFLSTENMLRTQQSRDGDAELIAAIAHTIAQKPEAGTSMKDLEKQFGSGGQPNPEQMGKAVAAMFKSMFAPDAGALKMLQQIGAKDLSTLVEGRRVVLSSNPNSMQGLLKPDAVQVIRQHMVALAANTKKSEGGDEDGMDMFSMMLGGNGLTSPEKVGQAAIFLATFQMTSRTDLSVEIGAYTADGEGIYKRMMQLPIVNPQEAPELPEGTTSINIPASSASYAEGFMAGQELDPMMGLVTGGGGIAAIMGAFAFAGEDGGGATSASPKRFKPISPETMALLSKPAESEPMAHLLSPIFEAEAARGQNVIAMPSDEAIKIAAPMVAKGGLKLETALAVIDRSLSQKVSTDGTWTIVQASSPLELRSAHCKRLPLQNLLKVGAEKGYVNLDDCANFATTQDTARGSELLALPMITASLRTSDLGSASALTKSGFDPLKLYWSLSAHQKQQLNSKRPVALAALNPAQISILARMVFNGPIPPFEASSDMGSSFDEEMQTQDNNDPDNGDGMGMMGSVGTAIMGPMMSMFGMGGAKLINERTVMLPNGIPVVGSIQLHSFTLNALQAQNTADNTRMIGAPEMFELFSGAGNTGIPFLQGMTRTFDSYKLATQKTHMFMFKFGKAASYFTTLYDVSVDQSKSYTKDQLPEKMRERMERLSRSREEIEKQQQKEIPPL